MKKNNVVDFRVLRLSNELEKYQKTGILPGILLDGYYSIDDIFDKFYVDLPKAHKKIADKLKEEYCNSVIENMSQLRDALRYDYSYVLENLSTEHDSFRIPEIVNKYRKGMNPVRAIYYDLRSLFREYNPENHVHHLLIGIVTDTEFNNILLNALERDIASYEKIIKRYYIPLTRLSGDIPLELFHARQTVKDFSHYHKTFRDARNWQPDE